MAFVYRPSAFMLPDSHYDKDKADRAVAFIENLCHTKGKWAGQPFLLLPWQEQIVRDLFGIVKENGKRQFLTAYIEIPKKQGKSELAAAIALYLLYADNEPSAEVYGAACDRNQASIVFDVARQMVEMSPALMRRSKIRTAGKRIINYRNAGFYQVLSAETGCLSPNTILQRKDGTLTRADHVKAGDEILAADGLTMVFDKVKSVRVEAPAPVLRIRTTKNREITVTEKHPFYYMLAGRRRQDLTHRYDWQQADSLVLKDRVAPALGWPYEYSGEHSISELEAWALGAWAGDGDCSHFRFINPDPPVIQKMRRFMESIGSTLRSEYSTRQKQEGKDRYQSKCAPDG